jgi:hypothetical protein
MNECHLIVAEKIPAPNFGGYQQNVDDWGRVLASQHGKQA